MTAPRPKGRRLDPFEAFEVTPWRALIVFRLATLGYAIVLTAHNNWRYPHRAAAWVVVGVMIVWSVLASLGYERARLRAWRPPSIRRSPASHLQSRSSLRLTSSG